MCKESCWSQPQFVVATVTPLPTLSKYLTVGLWYNCMGGKVAAVSTPLWVRSGNLSSEAGTRLHSIKEYTLFPRTVVLYCKMGFLEGKVLNPKEGDPSGEIVVVWENRNGVAHPSNHVPVFIFPSVDKGSAAMATKPPAVALKTELTSGGGRKWGGSPPKRLSSGPYHTRRSPAQREVGPAAALLQEAGSRQLG